MLVVASVLAGFGGYFFIDEAALYAQVEVLDATGEWTLPRPFPGADTDGSTVPMARSDVVGDRYAPFAKHPVHVLLARGADLVGGEVGIRLLSSAAVLEAGVAAALLSGESSRRRVVAFWTTIVASPLLFHANLVVAHGVAAAVVGFLFVVSSRRPVTTGWVSATAALALAAGLLRSEAVMLALAGSVPLAWSAVHRRSRREGALALAMASGGMAAYLLEPWLRRLAIGGGPDAAGVPAAGSTPGDLVEAAARSVLEVQGSAATTLGTVGVVLCAVASLVAVVLVARPRSDAAITVLAGVVALVGAAMFAIEPHVVTGLLWAFPALLVLVGAVAGSDRVDVGPRKPLFAAALFASLVAATQYSVGGGVEWGWRYVAVAVPLVTPAVAAVATALWDRRRPGTTAALTAVAAAAVVVQLGGLRMQRAAIDESEALLERAEAVAAATDPGWIVSLDASFGRFAYPLSIDGELATVSSDDLAPVLDRLRDQGVERVLLVWRSAVEPPLGDVDGFAADGAITRIGSGYRATILEHRGS